MPTWKQPKVSTFSGVGTILNGNQETATVRYDLRMKHYMTIVQTSGGISQHEGLNDTNGSFTIVDGGIPFDAANLFLELEDGRRLQIIIKNLSLPSGRGMFVGSGPFIDD